MLGVFSKYKSDIERASFQLTPANILGKFVAFNIDLLSNGLLLNDYFDFVEGDTENTLFKDKKFVNNGYTFGQTALQFVRGESPKVIVGLKEIKIGGWFKYKFITLDLQQVRDYFDKNYGKKSFSDIVTHLRSIKNSLVQTSFFTIDMLPKGVKVIDLKMPFIPKVEEPKSDDVKDYIGSQPKYTKAPFFANPTQKQSGLLVSYDFWRKLSYARSFWELSGSVPISQGSFDSPNSQWVPYINMSLDKFLLQKDFRNILGSTNDFWKGMVIEYERTSSSKDMIPFPQSIGNGMTSFDGDNLYVGNYLKGTNKPILGVYKSFDLSKDKKIYYLVYWDKDFEGKSFYNTSKSEVKSFFKIEKYDSLTAINSKLEYPTQKEFNEATGVSSVIQNYKNLSSGNNGLSKDEQFQNSLSIIDSSKVNALSKKNPKFKEVFDLAIAEIYKSFVDSPQLPQSKAKKEFYFKFSGEPTIFTNTGNNIDITNSIYTNKLCSSSDIKDLQETLNPYFSSILERYKKRSNSDTNIYFYLSPNSSLYFDNEPIAYLPPRFFMLRIRKRYGLDDRYILDFGGIEFFCGNLYDADNVFRGAKYFFENVVELSLKATLTLNVLHTCAEGYKGNLFEYFQRQVVFLIQHDLILSKSKLLEIQSEINKFDIEEISLFVSKAEFFEENSALKIFQPTDLNNYFGELIDKCCEKNPDLNEYFNPPMVISAEPVVEPIIGEPQIITTEPQVVEDDDFADIFAENNEVNRKLQELQQQVAEQDNLIDNLDL